MKTVTLIVGVPDTLQGWTNFLKMSGLMLRVVLPLVMGLKKR